MKKKLFFIHKEIHGSFALGGFQLPKGKQNRTKMINVLLRVKEPKKKKKKST